MASDFEKTDKIHTLFLSEVPSKMWALPVGNLLFVGGASAKKLNSLGIHTIGQLANAKIEVFTCITLPMQLTTRLWFQKYRSQKDIVTL